MLLKSKITKVEMLSDEWRVHRLGLFTSSNWYRLMGAKGFGDLGMNYIRSKVFEFLSGTSSEIEFDNDYTRHGNFFELEGIKEFAKVMGIEWLVMQKLIHAAGSRTSSTPDALWVKKESADTLSYDVSTIEIKSYQGAGHIKMCECDSLEDVKKENPNTFWQVLHQMEECDCLTGYGVFYNPHLQKKGIGGLKVFEFKKIDLLNDFKFLKERKVLALTTFDSIKNKLMNIKNN